MKNKLHLLIFVFLVICVGLVGRPWAEEELVTGYYDAQNDWFVFEWDNPRYGRQISIYDPPGKVKPVITVEVGYDEDKEEFIYNYIVANEEGAVQDLEGIYIELLSPVHGVTPPELSPEGDWYSNYSKPNKAWHWAKARSEPEWIPPGHSESGLSFRSKGIPVIMDSSFTGHQRKYRNSPGDSDTEEVGIAYSKLYQRFKEEYKEHSVRSVVKKTLAPGEPPDGNTKELIDMLIAMKHEAQDLGWIKAEGGDGIIKALDSKLDNAKKAIDKGNKKSARNILTAFIKEVEAQGCATRDGCPEGKHLSPEAYALLKFNAEHLISELKSFKLW